jgi:hypothetical protein
MHSSIVYCNVLTITALTNCNLYTCRRASLPSTAPAAPTALHADDRSGSSSSSLNRSSSITPLAAAVAVSSVVSELQRCHSEVVLTLQRAAELGLTSSSAQSPPVLPQQQLLQQQHQSQQQQQQQQQLCDASDNGDADYETDACELSSITMTPQSAYTNTHNSNYNNSGSRQSRRQLWQAGVETRQLPRPTPTSLYCESPYTPAHAGASSRRPSSLRYIDVSCDGDSSSGADVSPRRAVRRLAPSYTARASSASSTRRNSVSSDAAAQQQQQQRQRPQRSSSVHSSSAQRQRSQSVSTCVATPRSAASPVKQQQQQQQQQQQRRWSSVSMVSGTAQQQQQQQKCEWVQQGASGYCTRQRVDRRSEFSEAAALAAVGAGKPLWNVSTRGTICAEPFARRASIGVFSSSSGVYATTAGPVVASHDRAVRCWATRSYCR